MQNTNDGVAWDTPAATAYIKAAGDASTLLDTAKTDAETVAGIDLSGLGTLGAAFATEWAAAWNGHADQLKTAAGLASGYGSGIDVWGKVLAGVDTESAEQITDTVPGTDEIQA